MFRPRILLIAEACNPSWNSILLVGYNFARASADRPDLDVTVVTQVRNRPAFEGDPLSSLARVDYLDT